MVRNITKIKSRMEIVRGLREGDHIIAEQGEIDKRLADHYQ